MQEGEGETQGERFYFNKVGKEDMGRELISFSFSRENKWRGRRTESRLKVSSKAKLAAPEATFETRFWKQVAYLGVDPKKSRKGVGK